MCDEIWGQLFAHSRGLYSARDEALPPSRCRRCGNVTHSIAPACLSNKVSQKKKGLRDTPHQVEHARSVKDYTRRSTRRFYESKKPAYRGDPSGVAALALVC